MSKRIAVGQGMDGLIHVYDQLLLGGIACTSWCAAAQERALDSLPKDDSLVCDECLGYMFVEFGIEPEEFYKGG